MADTLVSDWRDPLRFLLGDHDEEIHLYEDSALDRGIRVAVRGGLLPGYSLTPDKLSVTPEVSDPNTWMLLAAKVAQLWVASEPSRESVRTRAWSKARGDRKELIFNLQMLVSELDGGSALFLGWQSLAAWVQGYDGVPCVWAHLLEQRDAKGGV